MKFCQSTANETLKKESWPYRNATIHDTQRPGSVVTFSLLNLTKQISAKLSFGCHLREKNQFSIWLTHMNLKISDANPTYVETSRNPDYW